MFIINHITLTNCSILSCLHVLGTQHRIFRGIKVASVIFPDIIGSTINRVFFCLLFVHIGVGYDRESDTGCLKVTGRKEIK